MLQLQQCSEGLQVISTLMSVSDRLDPRGAPQDFREICCPRLQTDISQSSGGVGWSTDYSGVVIVTRTLHLECLNDRRKFFFCILNTGSVNYRADANRRSQVRFWVTLG